MYMVMKLTKGIVVRVFGQDVEIPLTTGHIEGAVFIFSDKEKAEEFAGDEYDVVELQAQPAKVK